MKSLLNLSVATMLLFGLHLAEADDVSQQSLTPPSQHQRMKDCMAKQKASDGGLPKEDMKRMCRDVVKTEEENLKTEKAAETVEAPPPGL